MSTGHPLFCFTLYGIVTFYFSLENRKNCRSEKILLSCRVAATYVSHFPQDSRVCPLGSMVFLSWLFLWTLWRERLRFCCSEGEVGSAPGLECKAAVWTTRNLQCYTQGGGWLITRWIGGITYTSECLFKSLLCLWPSFLAMCNMEADGDNSRAWVSAAHAGNPDGVLDSWL